MIESESKWDEDEWEEEWEDEWDNHEWHRRVNPLVYLLFKNGTF